MWTILPLKRSFCGFRVGPKNEYFQVLFHFRKLGNIHFVRLSSGYVVYLCGRAQQITTIIALKKDLVHFLRHISIVQYTYSPVSHGYELWREGVLFA